MLKNTDTQKQPAGGNNENLGILPFPLFKELRQPSTTLSSSLDKSICHSFCKIYFTFPWLRTHKSYFKVTFIKVASNIEHLLIKWLGTSELHCT